jgi:hypothetical protein
MPTLIVTINGPFAYVNNYPQAGTLTLMAPMCPQHLAGISSIAEDEQYILGNVNPRNHPPKFGLCKPNVYDLRINPGVVCSSKWIGSYLSCPTPQGGFDPMAWRFWLRVPKPNVFVAVNPVLAEIIVSEKEEKPIAPSYAVGARLIYKTWDGNPIPLFYNDQPVQNANHQNVVFKLGNYEDDHKMLEIEYSSPLRDDPGHEDAVDCFESLMRALGLSWSIYIPPIKQQGALESGKLNDCKAAIAVVGSD